MLTGIISACEHI